jgi:single-stranded-DNA-specific exonuclease
VQFEAAQSEFIWKLRPRDEDAEMELARAIGVHSTVAALLRNRGISDPRQAREFLDVDLSALSDPFDLPDMRQAAERIVMAVGNGEPILVHGDYDADGITSTALMVRFLEKLGAVVHYFVPHRVNDRYGLNPEAIAQALQHGVTLLVAVDCGVTDQKIIADARSQGIDVIVIDHHEPGSQLPDAIVVNPKRHDNPIESDDLAAVGLTFQVASAVCEMLDMPQLSLARAFLDLVAIGTVADVSWLTGDNRIMVRHGLQLLPHTRKQGLRALLDICNVSAQPTAQDIAFRLAPRLNAVGRMADATDAVDLLLSDNPDAAMRLALELEGHNRNRQREQEAIFCDALRLIGTEVDLDSEPVVVLASPKWHIGVVGIVASKVVEQFSRPAFLMCGDSGSYRGSARSIEGFNIAEALESCSDLLLTHGGHEMAGGFSLSADNLDQFRLRLNELGRQLLQPQDLRPSITIDCELDIRDVDEELVESLAELEPYGQGNPGPVFLSRNVEVFEVRCVGADEAHLKLLVGEGHNVFDCIGFRMGELARQLRKGDRVHIVHTPEFNEFGGRKSLQLRLTDLRRADKTRPAASR